MKLKSPSLVLDLPSGLLIVSVFCKLAAIHVEKTFIGMHLTLARFQKVMRSLEFKLLAPIKKIVTSK